MALGVVVEPDRDVVVALSLAFMPQTNLVNEPSQMGNATEQDFGAAGG